MDGQIAHILYGIGRLAAVQRAEQWQAGTAGGLSPAQLEILSRVAVRPMRSGELAQHLGVSAASASDSIGALEGKGLVQRGPDPDDARAQRVVPTEAGLALLARLDGGSRRMADVLAALPEGDRADLMRVLTGIIRGLQEVGAIPVQRMCLTCRHFRAHAHEDAARPHHCDFVDAAFGDAMLRLDCGDHGTAGPDHVAANLRRFGRA